MTDQRILYLPACPTGTERLALDHELEVRAIQAELDRSGSRGRLELVTRRVARQHDLIRELHELKPTVVHFSGHGTPNGARQSPSVEALPRNGIGEPDPPGNEGRHGLAFQRPADQAQLVSTAALEETFRAAGASVRLVVLNACYTDEQANALLHDVDCVIGTHATIRDDAAMKFASGLYSSLGEGESVAAACRRGLAAISAEGMGDGERPRLRVRDGIDANQLVLTANRPASTTPTGEALLEALTVRATPDELRPIAHFLGECVARRQIPTLAQFHARARQLRRLSEPGSWHRGFADGLTAYVDGYLAELEPAVQREKLAREIASHALWREILYTLRDDRALNQVAIGERVAARAPGVASSKSAISIALEDLRVRELVEYEPGKVDRRERIHSLTLRGRELLSEPVLSSAMAHEASAGTIVEGSGTPPLQRPPDVADRKRERAKRRAAGRGGSGTARRKGDRPRKRRLSGEPSAAGR